MRHRLATERWWFRAAWAVDGRRAYGLAPRDSADRAQADIPANRMVGAKILCAPGVTAAHALDGGGLTLED